MELIKPASSGSVRKLLLHPFGMRWSGTDFLGTADRTNKGFMRYERMPALNIGALVVTLFGLSGDLKTTACVCGLTTQRTIHHLSTLLIFAEFAIMIHHYSILRTTYSISRSSIFTSSSRLVVKPLSGLTVCVRVVMVHSASSMGCLKPLTFTGISV